MLDRKTKKLLTGFKSGNYELFKITKDNENRIDLIMYDIYGKEDFTPYYKIFCYLNDITYPQDELIEGRYLRIYNIQEIILLLNSYKIDVSEDIFY